MKHSCRKIQFLPHSKIQGSGWLIEILNDPSEVYLLIELDACTVDSAPLQKGIMKLIPFDDVRFLDDPDETRTG